MRILFFGDIVGKVGRRVIKDHLPSLKEQYKIDFIIANAENATHGKGLSLIHYKELTFYGIDAITMGNHYLRVNEVITNNSAYTNMVRPANMHKSIPGVGSKLFTCKNKTIRVTNLIGTSFIQGASFNPFDCLDQIVKETKQDIHFVDFHAETTAEKKALAFAFDGKVSAIVGTHTHTQTNDEEILPNKTAFITDVGMNGLNLSVLGVIKDGPIHNMWTNVPSKFVIPETGLGLLNAVVITFDDLTNIPTNIEKIRIREK